MGVSGRSYLVFMMYSKIENLKGKKKRKEKVSQRTHKYWSRRIFKRYSTRTVYHAFPVPRRWTRKKGLGKQSVM